MPGKKSTQKKKSGRKSGGRNNKNPYRKLVTKNKSNRHHFRDDDDDFESESGDYKQQKYGDMEKAMEDEIRARMAKFNISEVHAEKTIFLDLFILQREFDTEFIVNLFEAVDPGARAAAENFEGRLNFCQVRDIIKMARKVSRDPLWSKHQKDQCARIVCDNIELEIVALLFEAVIIKKLGKEDAVEFLENNLIEHCGVHWGKPYLGTKFDEAELYFGVAAQKTKSRDAIPAFIPPVWSMEIPREEYKAILNSVPIEMLSMYATATRMGFFTTKKKSDRENKELFVFKYEDFAMGKPFSIRAPFDLTSVLLYGGPQENAKESAKEEKEGCTVFNASGCLAVKHHILSEKDMAFWDKEWNRDFPAEMRWEFSSPEAHKNFNQYIKNRKAFKL